MFRALYKKNYTSSSQLMIVEFNLPTAVKLVFQITKRNIAITADTILISAPSFCPDLGKLFSFSSSLFLTIVFLLCCVLLFPAKFMEGG